MEANIERLRTRLNALGVPLRLHAKTAKSLEVLGLVFPDGPGPIAVSTLAEAEFFADGGYTDILYAVGIGLDKLERVAALHRRGVELIVLLDSLEQAEALAVFCARHHVRIPALIEIDCDGHRGGVDAAGPELLGIAGLLGEGAAELRGVLAHAGQSYFCSTEAERAAAAEHERRTVIEAAARLREHGHVVPVVSVGSTPTAHAVRDVEGVSEVRAGNFVFFDLVMAGIGVCQPSDLALSVVTTVIGHRRDKGWILTDAGWMATSRDQGTSVQSVDQKYGLVATDTGELIPDLLMVAASQEHGTLAIRPGSDRPLPQIPVGTRLRILPVHACATAAQHDAYHVISTPDGDIEALWSRTHGW